MMARLAGWQSEVAVPDAASGVASLAPSRPNPCNPAATITYTLSQAMHARLQILDSRGRLVVELAAGLQSAGRHEANWSGHDAQGRSVASGSYYYRLETPAGNQIRKLVLLK